MNKFIITIAALALSVPAFAANNSNMNQSQSSNTSSASSQSSVSMQEMQSWSPKDVCQKISDAESGKSGAQNIKTEMLVLKRGAAHKQWIKKQMANADCSSETIAGNHAFVVTKSSNKEFLLPFVKLNGIWKMDVAGYHALYRMERRMPASTNGSQYNQSK